jgi:hypothetical protein
MAISATDLKIRIYTRSFEAESVRHFRPYESIAV